jgi:uncharacterized protein YraI
LRRTASVDGDVVHQLPTGTRVIVNARTADGEWLEATFENITGWIAADFVTLTFNGRKVEVLDVPLAPEDSQ